ncbi:MAG TPA: hypothetical protein DEB17_03045 [Chlorobaculum sp.]|uniref:Uncharacterized protein n=1 Tax=Chlorobaculum tepidum (strain ATCC 49652 / DSM 12025 / NBRC 103806 / TLS) TaxID=194439 RepID=Q8KE82_CHLTE|nr:hypothetical protein [Chlorobaculum tepidum]AAM72044.1 hypothetical protein CT0808 [Chlorobaculum tepidum TLS]HBU22962.1 hypothetical protein [Chlorobaculum sp.]
MLLESILASESFRASELPAVPDRMRKPQKATSGGLFDFEE